MKWEATMMKLHIFSTDVFGSMLRRAGVKAIFGLVRHNIFVERREKQLASMSEEQRKELAESHDKNLLRLKRARKPVFSDGDIFVLSPVEGMYLYGRILQAKINNPDDDWMSEGMLVFIFKTKSRDKSPDNFKLDYGNVLIGPEVVPRQYWTCGFFETVGNIPLTQEEKKLDYGFFNWDLDREIGCFMKPSGKIILHEPKFLEQYGICTLSGIYSEIIFKSILDPELLQF